MSECDSRSIYDATIITVCFNDIKSLKKTVNSVIEYKKRLNIEYIIVDGGSTDGTKEYLMEISDMVDKIISEPDKGIGDAWNKGIHSSSTDILNFLNAGDVHLPSLVEKSISLLKANNESITYANTVREIDGRIVACCNGDRKKVSIYEGFGFYHPTCFFNRSVIDKVGLFDPRIKIAVDTDWLVRAVKEGISFHKVNGITLMDADGVSSKNKRQAYFEYLDILKRNEFNTLVIYFYKLKFLLVRFLISSKLFSR